MIACAGEPPPTASDAAGKAGASPAPATPSPPKPGAAAANTPANPTDARTWTFDQDTPSTVPPGIRTAETGGAGTPAKWEVVADPTAPTSPHAFGVTQTTNGKPTYNLALVNDTMHQDVDLQVMVKAGTGELDRGGGPIWRVADTDNYYIARWNPNEHNARFYVVQSGVRTALGKVELTLDPTVWHALRVVAQGARMELFIDDEPVLTVEDTTHTKAGMIGLWTKADAATLFDDLSVAKP